MREPCMRRFPTNVSQPQELPSPTGPAPSLRYSFTPSRSGSTLMSTSTSTPTPASSPGSGT
eukprot:6379641-Heterocapsa_arctica.AAC.1